MILHENKDAFKALISSISERTDIREDIIEKCYILKSSVDCSSDDFY